MGRRLWTSSPYDVRGPVGGRLGEPGTAVAGGNVPSGYAGRARDEGVADGLAGGRSRTVGGGAEISARERHPSPPPHPHPVDDDVPKHARAKTAQRGVGGRKGSRDRAAAGHVRSAATGGATVRGRTERIIPNAAPFSWRCWSRREALREGITEGGGAQKQLSRRANDG